MLLETKDDAPPLEQIRKCIDELVMIPGETNYQQRALFVHAKLRRLLSMVAVTWAEAAEPVTC